MNNRLFDTQNNQNRNMTATDRALIQAHRIHTESLMESLTCESSSDMRVNVQIALIQKTETQTMRSVGGVA